MLVIRIGVLPWRKVFGWEKGSETSLEHIRASANCVRGVAVVGALAYNDNDNNNDNNDNNNNNNNNIFPILSPLQSKAKYLNLL